MAAVDYTLKWVVTLAPLCISHLLFIFYSSSSVILAAAYAVYVLYVFMSFLKQLVFHTEYLWKRKRKRKLYTGIREGKNDFNAEILKR